MPNIFAIIYTDYSKHRHMCAHTDTLIKSPYRDMSFYLQCEKEASSFGVG